MKPLISPFLQDIPGISAFLIERIPGLELSSDRHEALAAQRPLFKKIVSDLFPASNSFVMAEEIHGSDIAIITKPYPEHGSVANVDGLITADRNVVLGITIADCAPVWIIDRSNKAVALVHSGKQGTGAGIVPKAIALLQQQFSSKLADLLVAIGPCIRPPCYEVDFARTIREQATAAGVMEISDDQICTACNLDRYYSYRLEKGKTGHMLATVMLSEEVTSNG